MAFPPLCDKSNTRKHRTTFRLDTFSDLVRIASLENRAVFSDDQADSFNNEDCPTMPRTAAAGFAPSNLFIRPSIRWQRSGRLQKGWS